MKIKHTSEKWTYEFNSLSTISPNGQFTVKAGEIGTPICVIPMPIGGINTKEKQEEKAKLIIAVPEMLKALKVNYLMLLCYMPNSFRNTSDGQAILSNAFYAVVTATGKDSRETQDDFGELSVLVKFKKMHINDAIQKALEL